MGYPNKLDDDFMGNNLIMVNLWFLMLKNA
jgi:hypothetical protein